jgi:5-methylthioadenosine/S-adenosylhomocysteine deaminase
MTATVLRNCIALVGESLACDHRRPLDVLIRDRRIAAIEPAGSIRDAAVIDMSGRLLAPGMINSHYHSHEGFQKGRTENLPLELWMHYVRTPLPVPLNREQSYLRTMVSALEALRTGSTGVLDDMTLGNFVNHEMIEGSLQAYEDLGIRAFQCFAMMDRPIIDNFPFVADYVTPDEHARLRALPRPDPDEILATTRRLARERHPNSSRVSVIASASAPQRCTPEFLKAVRAMARELDLPVVTHVQETRMQVITGQLFYGKTMVRHLHDLGFLGPKTSLIHVVWANADEVKMLADTGTTVQHNPWSNLMIGSGVAPVRDYLDAGINVSMGSDGCCATFTTSMLNAVGSAAALSKVRDTNYERWLTAQEAYRAASLGGARALGLDRDIGTIDVGKVADFCAYRTDAPAFVPLHDPLRQLVYAERGQGLTDVWVEGERVIADGKLTRVDEQALVKRIGAAVEALVPTYEAAEASVAPIHRVMAQVYQRCEAMALTTPTFPARVA